MVLLTGARWLLTAPVSRDETVTHVATCRYVVAGHTGVSDPSPDHDTRDEWHNLGITADLDTGTGDF